MPLFRSRLANALGYGWLFCLLTIIYTEWDVVSLEQKTAAVVGWRHAPSPRHAHRTRESLTLWSASRQLVPGNLQRASWDYKRASVAQASQACIVNQDEARNDLVQLLPDTLIDMPHAGDSRSDYKRVSIARMLAHDSRAPNASRLLI